MPAVSASASASKRRSADQDGGQAGEGEVPRSRPRRVGLHLRCRLQFIGGPAVGTSAAIPAFVAVLKKELTRVLRTAESWTKTPKVIVRADDYEFLRKLQDEIFHTQSVLLHEQVRPYPPKSKHAKKNAFRGKSVAAMRKAHPNARFWLHQSKLIEGVDDPNFVAMALYDLMVNARQVIQQIGRMIRWKQRADKAQQSGFVLANEPNISRAKTIWAILEDVIAAIIKDGEKKARDAETEARRHELAVRREQERKQREQKREQERGEVKR